MVIIDYTRTIIVGLSFDVKCRRDRIYNFRDIAIFIVRRFELKFELFTATF